MTTVDDDVITSDDEGKALFRFMHAAEKYVQIGLTEGQKRALAESEARPTRSA